MADQGRSMVLHAAAVQMQSAAGEITANHQRALEFVKQAAAAGAKIVVLPELFAPGYIPNPSIWSYGEARDGPTCTWAQNTAAQLGVYLGAGFLERTEYDFFNSYVVADPQGEIAGIVRKHAAESYSFAKARSENVISTALGRLGVGICADNHLAAFLQKMQKSNVDLMLMPHASPAPYRQSRTVSAADVQAAQEKNADLTSLYAAVLGVPTIYVNPVGPLEPMAGLLGRLMTPDSFRLAGGSRIIAADGTVMASAGSEESLLMASVSVGDRQPRQTQFRSYGGWLHPGSFLLRRLLLPLDDSLGRWSYHRRRQHVLGR